MHRYQEALQCLEEAFQILTAISRPFGLKICSYNLGKVYSDLGAYETALQHYHKVFEIGRQDGHIYAAYTARTLAIAQAGYMGIATTHGQLGKHREALPYYRESLAISRQIGDRPDMLATLRRLAVTHEVLREFPEALACYQEALQLFRDLGDRKEERTILATMAHLYRQQFRDFRAALTCYQQSLAVGVGAREDAGRLALLKGLGATCWNLGHYEEAASAFEQALQIVEAAEDRAEQAVLRSSLGVVSLSLGRYATAMAHLQEGRAIAKAMGDLRAEGYILNALGNVYYEVGDQQVARDCYDQAVQLRTLIRDRKGEGWSLYYLGRVHGELGGLEDARSDQEQALSLAEETGDQELRARAKIALSAIHRRLESREAFEVAICYAREAVELARANGLRQEESAGLSHLAIAFLLLSNGEEALRCSEEAVRLVEGEEAASERELIWLNHAWILRACGREELAERYLGMAYEGAMRRLDSVRDARLRESISNAGLLREILAERTTRGSHDATGSG